MRVFGTYKPERQPTIGQIIHDLSGGNTSTTDASRFEIYDADSGIRYDVVSVYREDGVTCIDIAREATK